jgi:hypothetical protein
MGVAAIAGFLIVAGVTLALAGRKIPSWPKRPIEDAALPRSP